jgi:hypothetical protein
LGTSRILRIGFIALIVALAIFCKQSAHAASAIEPQITFGGGPCIMAPFPADASLYQVTGHVVDDVSGLPVPRATVRLQSLCALNGTNGRTEESHFIQQASTDEEGAFTFQKISAMSVQLTASREDYVQVWAFRRAANDLAIETDAIGSGTHPITLRIAPGASISGMVRNQDGSSARDAWVTLGSFHTWDGWPRLEYFNTFKTNSDGSYHLGPLSPGRYYVVVAPSLDHELVPTRDANGNAVGYVPLRFPKLAGENSGEFVELSEGQQIQADFQFLLEPLHHLSGSIAGLCNNVGSVQVVDRSESRSYLVKPPTGRCSFDAWVPSGNFRLSSEFTNPDGSFIGSMPIEVGDADLPGIQYSLQRNTRSDVPVEIITVAPKPVNAGCMASDPACGFWYLQLVHLLPNGYVEAGPQSTMSGARRAAGVYRTESLSVPAGNYAAEVLTLGNLYPKSITRGGDNLVSGRLSIQPGDTLEPIRIVLAEGGIVQGTTRSAGSTVRAWIYAIPELPDARNFQPALSDANGRFRFEGLAPIPYLFLAASTQLDLNIHDPEIVAYWRERSSEITPRAGNPTNLNLNVSGNQ